MSNCRRKNCARSASAQWLSQSRSVLRNLSRPLIRTSTFTYATPISGNWPIPVGPWKRRESLMMFAVSSTKCPGTMSVNIPHCRSLGLNANSPGACAKFPGRTSLAPKTFSRSLTALDDRIRALILEKNDLDFALYQYAVSRLVTKVSPIRNRLGKTIREGARAVADYFQCCPQNCPANNSTPSKLLSKCLLQIVFIDLDSDRPLSVI